MVSLLTPIQASKEFALRLREVRKEYKLTQEELSLKSGVALASLRKFERTGIVSFESFLKIAFTLNLLDNLLDSVKKNTKFKSIDEMIKHGR
jgi:transcriptional regulator with XRE-family HTH domain